MFLPAASLCQRAVKPGRNRQHVPRRTGVARRIEGRRVSSGPNCLIYSEVETGRKRC